MGEVVRCSIIIYDDFDNVLIAERGKKNERDIGGYSVKRLKVKKLTKSVLIKQ